MKVLLRRPILSYSVIAEKHVKIRPLHDGLPKAVRAGTGRQSTKLTCYLADCQAYDANSPKIRELYIHDMSIKGGYCSNTINRFQLQCAEIAARYSSTILHSDSKEQ